MIDRIRIAIREAINRHRDHLKDDGEAVIPTSLRDPARAARANAARRTLRDR